MMPMAQAVGQPMGHPQTTQPMMAQPVGQPMGHPQTTQPMMAQPVGQAMGQQPMGQAMAPQQAQPAAFYNAGLPSAVSTRMGLNRYYIER